MGTREAVCPQESEAQGKGQKPEAAVGTGVDFGQGEFGLSGPNLQMHLISWLPCPCLISPCHCLVPDGEPALSQILDISEIVYNAVVSSKVQN